MQDGATWYNLGVVENITMEEAFELRVKGRQRFRQRWMGKEIAQTVNSKHRGPSRQRF